MSGEAPRLRVLYRPVWEGVQFSLKEIFESGRPADRVVHHLFKANRKWGASDRRLFAEIVYDLVRWWRKLIFVSGLNWPTDGRAPCLDADDTAKVIEAWCLINDVVIDRAVATGRYTAGSLRSVWEDMTIPRAVRESIPDWLDEWGEGQLGVHWPDLLSRLNTEAPIFLRANRLKTTAARLVERLASDKIQAEVVNDDCLRLLRRSNVFLTRSFADGLFEMQDLNSQKVAVAMQAQGGMRVIDACAGGGGKSLHLASLMGNKGKIIALDVVPTKLEQLRERSKRAGATSIETRLIEGSKTLKRLRASCDGLLLDVPCSGLGVLRRNPDTKWRLSRSEVDRLVQLQDQILANYSVLCKPGATMVYSTCSILPCENEGRVQNFLSQFATDFALESAQTLPTASLGGDGFFIARFRKL